MTEQTPEQQAPAAQEATEQQTAEAPPWGDDFDPARAWEKIQKANQEARSLRGRLQDAAPKLEEYDRLVEASKSEAQRQAEALEAAKRDAETARTEAIRFKVAAAHGIGADHFELLGSGTEEEVTARAEKIAALLKQQAQQTTTPLPTRPVEQLRPGATPGEAESAEDVLYKQLFG